MAISILATILLLLSGSAIGAGEPGSGGINAADKIDYPYLILISIDGFRWDYQSMYETPALDRIAASGVRATAMRPVFPTLTFPNHYSIATGLHPAEHGIVHNHFPNEGRDAWYHLWDRSSVEDGRWYGGEPIWVAAERNGLVSAAYYFVGTEAAVDGVHPSHWLSFDETVSGRDRVGQVIEWLQLPEERRPHMITLYFEHVDDAGHDFGVGSPELSAAITRVDGNIGMLLDAIEDMGLGDKTSVVVISDHGQAAYSNLDDVLILDELIDVEGLDVLAGGTYAWIYQDDPDRESALRIRDAINANWDHGVAMLREETPIDWRISDSRRYPEIFLVPDLHHGVTESREDLARAKKGDHGWAPENREMHGIFLATGPRLPTGREIGDISAVDIYPLLLELLGIREPGRGVDGTDLAKLIAADE